MTAVALRPHLCRELSCVVMIEPGTRWRDFCSTACRRLYQHRCLARGARLYTVAMKWRHQKRSHTKGAKNPPNRYFGDMAALLDEWKREDATLRAASLAREAGSPLPRPEPSSETNRPAPHPAAPASRQERLPI